MYNSSGNNFYIRAKQTVYKWWCVIYKPVYKLFHKGYWPDEKEPYYTPKPEPAHTDAPETVDDNKRLLAEQMARQIGTGNQQNVDSIILSAEQSPQSIGAHIDKAPVESTVSENKTETKTEAQETSEDVMAKAQEIMERLAREAAEDEAKKQAEIDAARQKAMEQEQLASIMKANERDISIYIEEGKAHQADMNTSEQKGE